MNQREKEIRRILTGFVALDSATGDVLAGTTVLERLLQGPFAGTTSARLFGLSVRKRQYRLGNIRLAEVQPLCLTAFQKMGRSVRLLTAPDALGVLVFSWLFNPCVLTAETAGKDVLICFYAARTPFAFLNARRAFRKWEKQLGDQKADRVDVTMTPAVKDVQEADKQ